MNEETFNIQLRKFLKKVGVTSQREIEKAVRDALERGAIDGTKPLAARATVKVGDLGLEVEITDTIALE